MTRGLETLFPTFPIFHNCIGIFQFLVLVYCLFSLVHKFTFIDQKVNEYFTGCKLQILQMHVTAIVFST